VVYSIEIACHSLTKPIVVALLYSLSRWN